jgi:two-component system NtrC family sensor kinase
MLAPGKGVVSTIPEKCRRCYTCVRECPAKAIKVEIGQAMVIEDRCIACGNCVKVCALNAKEIVDCTPRIADMLRHGERVFACVAPSFVAAFHPLSPGTIITAIRKLGFAEVWEVAFGAELVSRCYTNVFAEAQKTGKAVITTACPAIVAYVEKHMPTLLPALAPVVSPMIAVAKAIKRRHGKQVHIIFLGPCIAKKNEFRDPVVAGIVDGVLTFPELATMFMEHEIVPADLDESFFDGPRSHLARSYPISGGLLKSAGLSQDILENDVLVTEGKDRVLGVLKEIEAGQAQARLYDLTFCEGCINGPVLLNNISSMKKKEIVATFVNEQARYTTQRELAESLSEFEDMDLSRTFTNHSVNLPHPSEKEIQWALRIMRKDHLVDQLNCGTCGYRSCREKAIAVCQGIAEPEMCLPYVVEELENSFEQIKHSHLELAAAQDRLLQSERLASMGQLSAGVAHEINNPLGTVLIYSHMMLKQLPEGDPRRADLEMIVSEATRCKTIVRGLLDFARQSRVNRIATNIDALLNDIRAIINSRIAGSDITLTIDTPNDLPEVMLDAAQIKQLLINLISNGIDACGERGEVKVTTRYNQNLQTLNLRVSDNGCGIPPENMSKLFSPFFTTKAPSKGTGLGLAIAYGVVKMHMGDISAESELGKGTTFTIALPVEVSGVLSLEVQAS